MVLRALYIASLARFFAYTWNSVFVHAATLDDPQQLSSEVQAARGTRRHGRQGIIRSLHCDLFL
jgi:hypothetical protein